MRPAYSLLFAFSLTILPALHAEKIDNRNFAIDTCFPTQNEIQLAEVRARLYCAKHASCLGAEPRFLAVDTSKLFPGEIQDLYPKLWQMRQRLHDVEASCNLRAGAAVSGRRADLACKSMCLARYKLPPQLSSSSFSIFERC